MKDKEKEKAQVKDEIVRYASEIGVDLIGFTEPSFPEQVKKILKARRLNGDLTGFEEQNEQLRTEPLRLMPSAKTIVSIALPYRTKDPDRTKPHFSRSSLGEDYHRVVEQRLGMLALFLKEHYGAESKLFCDTNPLLEREIARRAGLGFQGKNTSLITKKYGSYVFLGELLTELYIKPDDPITEECGSCRRCIDACPTSALDGAYRLSGRKCLSFLTQKKEALEKSEMERLGTRIYGCDTCQEVCPRNRDKNLSKIEEFWPHEWNYNINEEEFMNQTNKQFKASYGTLSAGWRGRGVLMRNLLIAMGNSGNQQYIEMISRININSEKYKVYIEHAIEKLLRSEKNEQEKKEGQLYSKNGY